jgi:hypothetical protein
MGAVARAAAVGKRPTAPARSGLRRGRR